MPWRAVFAWKTDAGLFASSLSWTNRMDSLGQERSATDDEVLLLARIRNGETHLFDRLVECHRRNVLLVCRSILENTADAEDAAQETLIKAFQRLDQLRNDQSFRAWLLRVALNEAREHRRKNSRWKLESMDDPGDKEDEDFMPRQFGDWYHVPSAEMEREQTRSMVESCLDALPLRYREILILREVEQLAMTEVAAILRITLAAATSRLHRARLEMREKVAPFLAKPTPRWIPLRMIFDMSKQMFSRTISCKKAMREVSNYIDGPIDPHVRKEIERHLSVCTRCAIVFDTTRQMLRLTGDGLVFPVPIPCKPSAA